MSAVAAEGMLLCFTAMLVWPSPTTAHVRAMTSVGAAFIPHGMVADLRASSEGARDAPETYESVFLGILLPRSEAVSRLRPALHRTSANTRAARQDPASSHADTTASWLPRDRSVIWTSRCAALSVTRLPVDDDAHRRRRTVSTIAVLTGHEATCRGAFGDRSPPHLRLMKRDRESTIG